MAQAFHIKLRKKINPLMQKFFRRLLIKEVQNRPIELDKIKRVIIVRVNYRIGNIIFTTPLINALSQLLPDVKIDMIIGASFVTPLMEGMPNINRVYSFKRDLLKHPLEMLKLKRELNQNSYDLMILPSGSSTSDAMMSWAVDATYKVGFYNENSSKRLTNVIDAEENIIHEALKPLALLKALGVEDIYRFNHYLDLKITNSEREESRVKKGIGIFRDARGEKKIENRWWQELVDVLQELNPKIEFIDILDPNNQEPLNRTIDTISEKNLRILASKIANLDAFICADTGPMHLASASLVPTIALFKTTSPIKYGTLGERDLSIVIKDKSIKDIAIEIYTHFYKLV